MPELPEIETIGTYLKQHILHSPITHVAVRQQSLRWPIPDLNSALVEQTFNSITRRSKYLLFHTKKGTMISHLGMSGRLIVTNATNNFQTHEHVNIAFANNKMLRFIDPRRFGAMLWTDGDPLQHKLLKTLGPEPLTEDFKTETLAEAARKRRIPIKQLIMDGHIVAGVGNIYANEALFMARIAPTTPAMQVSPEQLKLLTLAIKEVLTKAIRAGGSSIRDYVQGDGEVGRFQQQLKVYGRTGKPCPACQTTIQEIRLGQRNTFYCPVCQKQANLD